MLTVKDKNMKPLGVLENAYNVSTDIRVNEIWTAKFSLPMDDPKNELCTGLNYVDIVTPSGEHKGLYRISPSETSKAIETNRISYELEHVMTTLLSDILFKYHQMTNHTTREVLEYLLAQQTTKHWKLGQVDFTRYFHYSFENENGLLAPIYSIPQPFDEPYEFTYDTTSYPWTLNLIRPSDDVRAEIRWGKDMISFDEVSDPTGIVNRIYPLGSGEGVNQLDITDVNNGVPYLEDTASIAEYGLQQITWVDKRFKHADSLKASALSILNQSKQPKIALNINSVDLSLLPEYAHEKKHLNGVVRIIVEDKTYYGRILSERIADFTKEYEVDYDISNRLDDIADVQADLERKQQVNEAYSQGATNLDSYNFADNADPNFPAIIEFPIPSDMVNVNESRLRITTDRFRGYTRGSAAGGHYEKSSTVQSKSTSGGGAYVKSSTVQSKSTASGGGQTSSGGGDHHHVMYRYVDEIPHPDAMKQQYRARAWAGGEVVVNLEAPGADVITHGSSGDHTHTIANHTHDFSVTIPAINIPNHAHNFSVTIPAINIPEHSHEQIYGIYEHNTLPTRLTVKIDGTTVAFSGTSGELDITDYLRKDSNGKVTRDWHTIEVTPNDLARISLIVSNRFFIRSQIGQQL